MEFQQQAAAGQTSAAGTAHVWCRFAGSERGDCEHFIGVPKTLEYPADVDEYGIPHGWCEYCWLSHKFAAERERLARITEKISAALDNA